MTQAAKKVADAYGVKFVAGTLMEQITRCGATPLASMDPSLRFEPFNAYLAI